MDLGPGAALSGQPFVGREQQLALLAAAFAGVTAGQPRLILVHGEAGMGKSALLSRATGAANAAVLLRAVCDEAESALHLGMVSQLAAGISPLPTQLAGAGRAPGSLDPLAAGAGLLALLGELQDRGPVVLVVDDAHWADSASLHALAFCLRRLRADRVLALLAARTGELDRLPRGLTALAQDPTGMTVPLTGLHAEEISELARALGAGVLSPRAAQRLAQHTAGSPLLAGALLAEHGAARLSTAEGLAAYAPRSFSTVVLARLAGCATQGRELALAGSVLGLRWPLAHAAELAGVADPLAAADEAVDAGLITVEHRSGAMPLGGFRHPLVRAALYGELTLVRRAALHRAAAELAEDPRDALRHRVEAEIGPNPALAAELAATASKEEADGSWATAGRTYLWAARVAHGRADRERHVLNAAVSLLLAGDVAEAREVVGTAASFTDGARLHLARGYLAWIGAAFGAAETALRTAYDLASQPDEREVAARAADLLASLCVYLGRGAEGITWARRSLQTHPDPLPGGNPRNSVLIGHGIRGRMSEGLAEAARFDSHPGGARYADGLMGRGTLRLWADDPAGARQDLLPVAETCLRHGPLETGMFAAVHLADAEWRLGLWDDALLHGEAAVSAAAQALHEWFAAEADAVAAFPLIARGDWDAAGAHVRAAVTAAKRVGYGHGTLWTIVARARLADARADAQGVVRALTPLLGFTAVDGVDHPGLHSWRELLGAALVALGRAGEASEHAAVLERQAQRLELRSARARALRLRGLIEAATGRYPEAIRLLDDALTEFGALPQPFDLALAEADLGACLRRAGRRRAATQRLRHAEAALTQLGAAPYLARVRQELAACGLRPARDGVAAGEQLTPAELSVARLVASGKSNREVATELVLSTKTVEHHLGRIYAKLTITSRTQLALRLADR